jgi:hypothetical protein
MLPRFPRRFGIRFMLVSIAMIAVTIVATRDYVRVQNAREQFGFLWAAHRQVSFDKFVAASRELKQAEESTFWTSRHSAAERHVKRMAMLLEEVQSHASEFDPEVTQSGTDDIELEIKRYSEDL